MVAALVAGSVAATVVIQHARHEGPIADSIRLKTKPEGRYRICFRLTRTDTVDVELVGVDGSPARSLGSGQHLSDDAPHCYDWDGRTDAGEPVTPGRYRLRLRLENADRVATSGERLDIPAGSPSQ